MLPQFILAHVIAKHNQNHKTEFRDSETFKFPYFKASILSHTNATIALFNNGEYLYRWSDQEKEFQQNSYRKLEKYQLKLKNISSEKVPEKKYSAEFIEHVKQKNTFFNWCKTLNEILSQTKTWEYWLISEQVFNKIKLGILKKQYEESTHYMLLHPDTLIYFSEDIIPDLIKHYKLAKKHLARYKSSIPSDIYLEYKNYLDDFLTKAALHRKKLAEAMLLRLQIFSESKLANSHPLPYFHQELKNTGAILQEDQRPDFQEVLTEKQFQYFHAYIEQSGSEETKHKLKSLTWFNQENSAIKTQLIQTKNEFFLVPESLSHLIPLSLRSPRWLFYGSNLRHEYFKDKNILLAKLKFYPNITFVIENLDQKNILKNSVKELNALQNILNEEITNLSKNKFNNLGFFQNKTKQFFKSWNKQLCDYRENILNDKLTLVEKISESLDKLDLARTITRSWSQCAVANDLLQTLEHDLRNIHHSDQMRQRFLSAHKKLSQQLTNYRLLKIIRKLSKGYILKTEEFSYFLDLNKMMQLNNPDNYRDFLSICAPNLINIQNLLYTLLKQNPFKSLNYQDDRDIILMLNIVADKCNLTTTQVNHQKKIESLISKYFLQYIEILLRLSKKPEIFDKNEKIILAMEEIIKLLGNNKFFANKSLKTHIEEIQQIRVLVRQNQLHWNVLESRCQALIYVILPILVNKRFNKDIDTFDRNFFALIQEDESLNYSKVVMSDIAKIFKQQETTNDFNRLELKPEERSLIGCNGGNSSYIKELLMLRGGLYTRKKFINSTNLECKDKLLIAADAAKEAKECINHCDKTRSLPYFYCTHSRRHPLFSKTYINPTFIQNTSDSVLTYLTSAQKK